jgi:hypothetical protein
LKNGFPIRHYPRYIDKIKGIENSFIAVDGIEYPMGNKIPLWLFGFLY